MKVCPTNALQPASFDTGLQGLWTPILVPSIGPCAEKCTSCGDVCPTGAIRPFTWQDKRYKLKMGLANVNRSTCVAWNGGRDCIVCAEVCPYSAVIFKDTMDDTLPKNPDLALDHKDDTGKEDNRGRIKRVPTVDEKLCTGCGICEYHCPVLPDHSIVVYTFQEDRGEGNDPKDPQILHRDLAHGPRLLVTIIGKRRRLRWQSSSGIRSGACRGNRCRHCSFRRRAGTQRFQVRNDLPALLRRQHGPRTASHCPDPPG